VELFADGKRFASNNREAENAAFSGLSDVSFHNISAPNSKGNNEKHCKQPALYSIQQYLSYDDGVYTYIMCGTPK